MASRRSDLRPENDARDRDELDPSIDAGWYLRRYPDVAAAGCDPIGHYNSYGRAEGRFPNAVAETAALGEVVDPTWYLTRYPDLARAGVDPVEHYRRHGRAEGRYPNADLEPRGIWQTRFDPIWYRARNPDLGVHQADPLEHFRRIGLLEGRAANASEEDRDAWRTILDADWYLARNPDVASLGLDPLEHFITSGLIDRRRPNADTVLEATSVTEAKLDHLKVGAFGDEIALFVTHAADGVIKPHVAHHIGSLKRCGIRCALIVACDRDDADVTGAATALADHVFRRANAGYDFAAWAHVLRLHPEIRDASIVYLVNDSVFGPTDMDALERVITRIRASEADLIGLTDNPDRGWHVQSYFLALKRRFIASNAGRTFFDGIVSYIHKDDVVNEYETQLARFALQHGFRVEVLFPTPDRFDSTLHNWKKLLRAGLPYMKVGTTRNLIQGVETAGWREEMAARGYDTSVADQTLARLARERRGEGLTGESDRDDDGAALAELHTFLAEGATLDLRGGPRPQVSFLLVLDGRPGRALRVVRALAQGERTRVEFVIVDNASIDDTHHVLKQLLGAVVVTNVAPLPTLRAARQAAARAKAEIVVLLWPIDRRASEPTCPTAAKHGREADPILREALAELSSADADVAYEPHMTADVTSWQAFGVRVGGQRVGMAYAMRRGDTQDALASIVEVIDPSQADEARDRSIL